MNHFHEYAQLAAFAMPFLAIAGMNVYLWAAGERGTLLVPSSGALPSLMPAREQVLMPKLQETAPFLTAAQQALVATVPANDVREREAA